MYKRQGLGAAQQANSDLNGIDAPEIALGYAVAYPLGVVGCILSLLALKYTPVSYTHLDVYKRQVLEPTLNELALLGGIVVLRTIPVSYTHLDVYKRQMLPFWILARPIFIAPCH